jgi:hypothetical protein
MAIQIQIRRDTASNWSSNNPTLAIGELGFVTDTSQLKIGSGSVAWNSLPYFLNSASATTVEIAAAVANLIDLSPSTLNTLNELAAAIGDDANFFTTVNSNIVSASAYTLSQANAYADGLTTADVAENTNLYFTNERAVNAGSATYILQSNQQGIINSASAAAVTAVLDGAPGALDTLNELAAALNDDASFATTITNSISEKLSASTASATYLTQAAYASASPNFATDAELASAIVTASAAAVAYADALTTADVAENTNLYFTNERAVNAGSATYLTQADYASASPNFATDAELANKLDTSTYASASANFATDAELTSAIVTASAAAVAYADALTTADVAENTNLYFTNERAVNAGSATYILQSNQQGIINSASAAAVTAVLDGAPGALDTLNELAAALNDDASFATTITNSISEKLSASTASATYLTQAAYASASPNFATDAELASAIVTASAAAVAYADALTTADVAENTNLYFTDERAQDAIGTILGNGLSYNDEGQGIGVNYVTLGNTLLDGVSGTSYGLIGTSQYLDIKNTNGYNKEIELDIAAVKTQLNSDGYLTQSSASGVYATQVSLASASAAAVAYADGLTTTDVAEGTSLYYTNTRGLETASTAFVHANHTGMSAVFTSNQVRFDITAIDGGGV